MMNEAEHINSYSTISGFPSLGYVEIDSCRTLNYLKATRQALMDNPKNLLDFRNKLDRLIQAWNTENRNAVLDELSKQEKGNGFFSQLCRLWAWDEDPDFSGIIGTDEKPGYRYIYEQHEVESLDGLFKKIKQVVTRRKQKVAPKKAERKENRQERKETRHENKAVRKDNRIEKRDERKENRQENKAERKEDRQERKETRQENKAERKEERKVVVQKAVHVLNRLNPVTVLARNGLRVMISFNFLGLATILNDKSPKSKEILAKTEKLYNGLGGDVDKLMQSIQTGSRKKPLLNKDAQALFDKNKNAKFEGLGSVTLATAAASGGGLFAVIWSWVKKAGIAIAEKVKKVPPKIFKKIDLPTSRTPEKQSLPTGLNPNSNIPFDVSENANQIHTSNTEYQFSANANQDDMDSDKSKKSKTVLFIVSGLVLASGAALAYHKIQQTKQT